MEHFVHPAKHQLIIPLSKEDSDKITNPTSVDECCETIERVLNETRDKLIKMYRDNGI
jgi:hypothetical protein